MTQPDYFDVIRNQNSPTDFLEIREDAPPEVFETAADLSAREILASPYVRPISPHERPAYKEAWAALIADERELARRLTFGGEDGR